jgi:FPC/CPF motif-containing protein YcgG
MSGDNLAISNKPPWDWYPQAISDFAAKLNDPAEPYPCHFGTRAQELGNNYFISLDSRLPRESGVRDLAAGLLEFREHARSGPRRRSLVMFAGPPRGARPDFERDQADFWGTLGALSVHDPEPWPADQPRDTTHPRWQWCFAGEPWFVFAGSPAYHARRSRNLGPCLTVIFQTRHVFEGLSGSTPAGQTAKRMIRDRLARYDTVGPHPHLGDPLHSSTYKWRQYSLPDDQGVVSPLTCPYRAALPSATPGHPSEPSI